MPRVHAQIPPDWLQMGFYGVRMCSHMHRSPHPDSAPIGYKRRFSIRSGCVVCGGAYRCAIGTPRPVPGPTPPSRGVLWYLSAPSLKSLPIPSFSYFQPSLTIRPCHCRNSLFWSGLVWNSPTFFPPPNFFTKKLVLTDLSTTICRIVLFSAFEFAS